MLHVIVNKWNYVVGNVLFFRYFGLFIYSPQSILIPFHCIYLQGNASYSEKHHFMIGWLKESS